MTTTMKVSTLAKIQLVMQHRKILTMSQYGFVDDNVENENDNDSDEEYTFQMSQPNPNVDTNRIDEIPAKEPKFNAKPLRSALKKTG